ncbi:MAG: hypothetical protein ABI969_02350 [bacterium]
MNDDEFDDLLRDAAATYNAPIDTPRERMWDAIARARAANAVTIVPIAAARSSRRWLTAAAGIAAILLVGIAIGRASLGVRGGREMIATQGQTAATPDLGARQRDDSAARPVVVGQANSVAHVDVAPGPSERRGGATPHQMRIAAQRGERRDAANAAGDLSSDATTYRLAVVEHLTRTEVLLTSFRAEAQSPNNAKLDAQFAALSRELLGTTRLLLATRRGEDPAITRLLQDLEFVLMQLSQYANDGRRIDLDAINQSLDKRNVIPKLRSTIPAGVSASAGT